MLRRSTRTGARINEIPVKPETVLDALARLRDGRPGLDEELTAEVRARLEAADEAAQRPPAGPAGAAMGVPAATAGDGTAGDTKAGGEVAS